MSKIMRALEAEARAERLGLKRYACDPADPGYANWMAAGRMLEVRVDGRLVPHCTMADEVAGVVLALEQPYRLGSDGELAVYELRGEVRVSKKAS
jgi:hypothetical protein